MSPNQQQPLSIFQPHCVTLVDTVPYASHALCCPWLPWKVSAWAGLQRHCRGCVGSSLFCSDARSVDVWVSALDFEAGRQCMQEPRVLIKFQRSLWALTTLVTFMLITETSLQSFPPTNESWCGHPELSHASSGHTWVCSGNSPGKNSEILLEAIFKWTKSGLSSFYFFPQCDLLSKYYS